MYNAARKRVYLLVALNENNGKTEQILLEIATKYNALPYTSKEKNSFIFDVPSEFVHGFRHRISTLPVSIKMLMEKWNRTSS